MWREWERFESGECANVLIQYQETSLYGVFPPSAFRRFAKDVKKIQPGRNLLFVDNTKGRNGEKLIGRTLKEGPIYPKFYPKMKKRLSCSA